MSVWESGVLLWLQNNLRNPITDPMFAFFTHLGDHALLFIALTLALLVLPKTRRVGLATGLALLCSFLFTNLLLKLLVARPRPWVTFPAIVTLVTEPDPNSFPSGHTSAAFAFALALVRACPPALPRGKAVKLTAVILAGVMAFSRLYVGVHYPTDVLAGFVAGDLSALVGCQLSVLLLRRAGAPRKTL